MLHFSNQPVSSEYTITIVNDFYSYTSFLRSFNQSKILTPHQVTNTVGLGTVNNFVTTLHNFKNIIVSQSIKSLSPRTILFDLGFPFGYIGGNSANTNYSISLFEMSIAFEFGTDKLTIQPISSINSDVTPPVLLNYNLLGYDGGNRIVFQLLVSDAGSGVKSFGTLYSTFQIGSYIVSGTNKNCTLEIDMEFQDTPIIVLCDNANNCRFYSLDSLNFLFKSDDNLVLFQSPKKLLSIPNTFKYLQDLVSITFKYNNLKVTGISKYNLMTIKLSNFPNDRVLLVRFYPAKDNQYANENTPIYYARYNSDPTIQAYQCEFIVPANIGIGELDYSITLDMIGTKVIYSLSLPTTYQLIINESNQFDFIGPIVTKINAFIDKSNSNQTIVNGILTIEDSVNGYYGNGYILVRGDVDMVIRNITADKLVSGNVFSGEYQFSFTIPIICTTQIYSTIYAKFIDSQGWTTIYDQSSVMGTLMNPFYPLLNMSNTLQYYHICNSSLLSVDGDTTLPTLNSFTSSLGLINVIGTDDERTVSFSFMVSHPDGIILDKPPTIYLTSTDQEIVFSNSLYTSIISKNETTFKFNVTMNVPYGFGYSRGILISLYGVVSNAGTHIGFTSSKLNELGFLNVINPIYVDNNKMVITNTSQLSSNGGILWIYGKRLDQVNNFQMLGPIALGIYPNSISKTAISVLVPSNAQQLSQLSITIRLNSSNGFSNEFIIQPFQYKDINYLVNSPTVTPTPTKIQCKSTCGISNNRGYCSTQGYCICNSPYIGSDCSSTIITVPPPTINETQPSTEIKIPNEEIKYSSIVSIVSIRELNFESVEQYSYTFEKWVFNSILDTETIRKYSYFSNITDSNNKVISNITAVLEWNTIESTVEFAGQSITLLPSSIKYTISISEYPFSNQLNSLQLIMSTSIIKSSSNDKCLTGESDIEFGDTSSSTSDNQNNSDSNYIELKVDNYLFYGRFIKRALIDNKNISITNTKLSDDNIQVKLGSSSSKIGINIPWYQSNAIIDPDFSLLIQPNNDANSNCNDDGLTNGQLAGIIIGSVALFLILIIITITIIYKSSRCFAAKILLYKLLRKNKQ